jgi:hypothetical protein
VEGWGRIELLGGYRWVPNWYFFERAAALGRPVVKASLGGPQAGLGFGYGASDWLEIAIDLFGAVDWFELPQASYAAITYGGLLGPRLVGSDVLFRGFNPYLGVEAGPTFVLLQSSAVTTPERLLIGLAVVGGFHWRIADRWSIAFDVRWLWARGAVAEVASFNAGGVLVSAGLSYLFPPAPHRDLEVPGFGAPSRL